jgi:hypothetical protein
MIATLNTHIRSNVVGYVALMVALIGVPTTWAVARNTVGSAQIKPNAVKASELADNAVRSGEVADGALSAQDFAPGQLPLGPTGPPGPAGANGDRGPAGSPDTPAQVLEKVSTVDGAGSGLDADRVDGGDPVAGSATSSLQGESGATVTFGIVATIPGVGNLEGDCNAADASSSAETRFNLADDVDARITVDSGGATGTFETLFEGATSKSVVSAGFTESAVDFQIWRVQAFPTNVTLFTAVRHSKLSTFDLCEWTTSVLRWTETP